jgi:pseudolysin/vibriolysin
VPKAFKVFARANALYWTASSTFNSGACGVQTAATDLGYTVADVTAAFTLVGVSCSGGGGGGTTTTLTNGVGGDRHRRQHRQLREVQDGRARGRDRPEVRDVGRHRRRRHVREVRLRADRHRVRLPSVHRRQRRNLHHRHGAGGTYYVNIKAYSTFSGAS